MWWGEYILLSNYNLTANSGYVEAADLFIVFFFSIINLHKFKLNINYIMNHVFVSVAQWVKHVERSKILTNDTCYF